MWDPDTEGLLAGDGYESLGVCAFFLRTGVLPRGADSAPGWNGNYILLPDISISGSNAVCTRLRYL